MLATASQVMNALLSTIDMEAVSLPRLYHYTSAAGLKGILEGHSVWASDYRFLNDSQEFRHGVAVFQDVMSQYGRELESLREGRLMTAVRDLSSALLVAEDLRGNKPKVFIASFTAQADLLSQWRGYNGGKGFSIGFNHQWLSDNADAQHFDLAPVVYDEKRQREVFIERLELLRGFSESYADREDWQIAALWLREIMKSIAFLKHPSFAEEQEYRAVAINSAWPRECKVRPTPSGLIPYMEFDLTRAPAKDPGNHANNMGFEHIIIGPALHDRQKLAIDAMQSQQHMRFEVTKSEIPFVAD